MSHGPHGQTGGVDGPHGRGGLFQGQDSGRYGSNGVEGGRTAGCVFFLFCFFLLFLLAFLLFH